MDTRRDGTERRKEGNKKRQCETKGKLKWKEKEKEREGKGEREGEKERRESIWDMTRKGKRREEKNRDR